MIQPNEIRIGNWLLAIEKPFQFTQEHWYQVRETILDLKDLKPIPITEEWLLKFDFRKETVLGRDQWQTEGGAYAVKINHSTKKIYFQIGIVNFSTVHFVHQLQNLNYALTGMELMIKDQKPS